MDLSPDDKQLEEAPVESHFFEGVEKLLEVLQLFANKYVVVLGLVCV